jgi:curved DNA-binding protein CbpA
MVNYYKILKVSPKATTAEIKSAYRRLAREVHPDVNSDSEKATADFALIAKAYEILSDPQERAFYDRQLRKAQSIHSIHTSDSVFHSDNPHARRLRQMAIERRYNEIIDRMMDAERSETIALQKIIFPTVALFVSTCFVAIFKPLLWTNSQAIGKIILLTLFVIGVLHLFKRLRSGFERYTYDSERMHNSIFDESEPETKPYSRFAAAAFLVLGIAISLVIGLIIGNFVQVSVALMPKIFSPTLQPEIIFYPPIVVLLVDLMHSFASKMDY